MAGIAFVGDRADRAGERHTYFLYDGRAHNLLEAILRHGGEAEPMRDTVVALPKAKRGALVQFLERL